MSTYSMRTSLVAFASAMTLGGAIALAQTPSPSVAPSAKPTTPPAAAPAGKHLSDAECTSAWQKAIGSSKATTLDEKTSGGYLPDFKAADTNGDKKIDQSEWKAACGKGLVVASAERPSGASEHPPTNRMDKMVPPMKAQ